MKENKEMQSLYLMLSRNMYFGMQFMNVLTNCVRTADVIQELKIIRQGEGF
jgi:hypothetical protein